MTKRIYESVRWRRLRALKLRSCPWCQYCPEDRKRAASQVDHYIAIADGGPAWSWENLRSSCATCHSQKTMHGERLHGCDESGLPRDARHWWHSDTNEKSLTSEPNEPRSESSS